MKKYSYKELTFVLKRDQHDKAIENLKLALKYTDDEADVYSMIGMEYLFMDNLEQAKINFIKCLEHDDEELFCSLQRGVLL